jgi:hypothetical protein
MSTCDCNEVPFTIRTLPTQDLGNSISSTPGFLELKYQHGSLNNACILICRVGGAPQAKNWSRCGALNSEKSMTSFYTYWRWLSAQNQLNILPPQPNSCKKDKEDWEQESQLAVICKVQVNWTYLDLISWLWENKMHSAKPGIDFWTWVIPRLMTCKSMLSSDARQWPPLLSFSHSIGKGNKWHSTVCCVAELGYLVR